MNTRLILPAIVITFTICSVLTIYALITPYDFTIWGGALVMMLLTVIIVTIVANLLPMEQSKMFILIILAILTFLTGMFFVYDI